MRAWNNPGKPDHGGGGEELCVEMKLVEPAGACGVLAEKLPLFLLRTMESLRNSLIGVILCRRGRRGHGESFIFER